MKISQHFNAPQRPDLAQITVDLLTELIASPVDKAESAAKRTLQVVGDAAGFDRTYIFQMRDGDTLDNTDEWVAAGIEPMIDRLQGLPASLLGPWLNALPHDRSIDVPDIDVPDIDALDRAHPARELLVEQGIRSLLLVPMLQDGELLGFLGYDAVRARRCLHHDEVFLLRCAANGVSALLARGRMAQARDRAIHAPRDLIAEKVPLKAACASTLGYQDRGPRANLPVAAGRARTPCPATPPAPPTRRAWGELSVLLAADNPMNLLLLRSMFEALDIRADSACDGHEALGLWKVRRHDLIIMDAELPGMDPIATLAAIRENAALAGHGRPVALAVTASAPTPQSGEHLAAGGFDRCLAPPIRRTDLEAAIAAFWPRNP